MLNSFILFWSNLLFYGAYVNKRRSEVNSALIILKDEGWIQNTQLALLLHLCQAEHSVWPANKVCPDWHMFLTLTPNSLLAYNLEHDIGSSLLLATDTAAWTLQRSHGCTHLQKPSRLSLYRKLSPLSLFEGWHRYSQFSLSHLSIYLCVSVSLFGTGPLVPRSWMTLRCRKEVSES